jgi:hypothetical protein
VQFLISTAARRADEGQGAGGVAGQIGPVHARGIFQKADGRVYIYDGHHADPVVVELPEWAITAAAFQHIADWLDEAHPALRRMA